MKGPPYRGGISAQGAPALIRQSIPSTTSRAAPPVAQTFSPRERSDGAPLAVAHILMAAARSVSDEAVAAAFGGPRRERRRQPLEENEGKEVGAPRAAVASIVLLRRLLFGCD